MKKLAKFNLLAIIIIIVCCSCSKEDTNGIYKPILKDNKAEIALITDVAGLKDGSFNDNTWFAIKDYAVKNNKTCTYYQSDEKTELSNKQAIEKSIENGAKIVITPGYLFEKLVYKMQMKYPDVKFILLDAYPTDEKGNKKIMNNTYSIVYSEEQAGYLAGYAIVKEGYRSLGFMGGMEVPSVVRFGFGYVQGISDAAKELKLSKDDIHLKYTYVGSFEDNPENEYIAETMYSSGVEVIFACGGAIGYSVMRMAEKYNAKVIGVDGSQAHISNTLITSAMKDISGSVYKTISNIYSGDKGGKVILFDMNKHGILLDMQNSRFKYFTQQDHDKLYDRILSGEIVVFDDSHFANKMKNIKNITIDYIK